MIQEMQKQSFHKTALCRKEENGGDCPKGQASRNTVERSRAGLLIVRHRALARNDASIGHRLGISLCGERRGERGVRGERGRSVRGVRSLGGWDVRLIVDDLQVSGVILLVALRDGQGIVVTVFEIVLGNPGERALIPINLGSDGFDLMQGGCFASAQVDRNRLHEKVYGQLLFRIVKETHEWNAHHSMLHPTSPSWIFQGGSPLAIR